MQRYDNPRGGYRGNQEYDREEEDYRARGTNRGYGTGGPWAADRGGPRMADYDQDNLTPPRGYQNTRQGSGINPGNREAYGDWHAENEFGQGNAYARDEWQRSGEYRQGQRGGAYGQGRDDQSYTNKYFGSGQSTGQNYAQNYGQSNPNYGNRYDQGSQSQNYGYQGYGNQNYGNQGYGQQGGSYGAGSRQSYGQNYGSSQGDFGYSSTASQGQNQGAMDEWGFGSPFAPRGWMTDRSATSGRDRSAARDRQDEQQFAGRSPKNYQRSDDRIREDICDRLMSGGRFDPSDVEVAVKSGEVTLSGTVRGRQDKYAAEELADSILGVKDVNNQLRVKRSSGEDRAESDTEKQQHQQSQQKSGRNDSDKSASGTMNSGRQTSSISR